MLTLTLIVCPLENMTHGIYVAIKDCFAIVCHFFPLTVIYSLSRDKNEASNQQPGQTPI